MPRNNTALALERLGHILNNGSVDQLNQSLKEFEQIGLQKDKLINYPIQRYNGRTAVHLAANNGFYDCLDLLLKYGGNPNAISSPTDLSQTPLHIAARKGYPRCIQTLLDHGARMDIKNTHRETANDLVKGKVKCERVFQHAIARYQIPQRTSEQQKRVEALHEIIGVGDSIEDFYQLYEQLPQDHKDLATRWTDFYQQTLLYRAASSELLEVVKFMLSMSSSQPLHNLDTNDTPLLMACRKSLYSISEILLEHSPRLVFKSEARSNLSPLHIACSKGDSRMVKLLLKTIKDYVYSSDYDKEMEINLDFRDELGRTPLFNACYYGFFDIVKMLIDFQRENSAYVSQNVNAAVRNTQRTPLHVAVRKGCLDIVKLLLSVDNININVEARPSARTQGKMIFNFQKRFQSCLMPETTRKNAIESIQEEAKVDMKHEDESLFSPDIPMSPPGTRSPVSLISISLSEERSNTPHSLASSSSESHIDDGISFMASNSSSTLVNKFGSSQLSGSVPRTSPIPFQTRPYVTLPNKRSKKQHASKEPVKECDTSPGMQRRSQTESNPVESGNSNLQILEITQTGKFEFQMKESETQTSKDFDLIFMSPLAEACACGHTKLMKLLLSQGAKDENGLACRLAHLARRPDLIRLILAYHTVLKDNIGEHVEDSIETMNNLELHWSYMKLPICEGEWLCKGAEYYPMFKDRDRDYTDTGFVSNADDSSNKLRSSPLFTVHSEAIRVVQLDNNQLKSVPIELFQLKNVQKINISYNKITSLPSSVNLPSTGRSNIDSWTCPQLMELNISKNELTHLPTCLWELPSLKRFICSRNKLSSLLEGDELTVLSLDLEIIDLSHNSLTDMVPQFIFEFPSLRILNLSNNKIRELPETLWSCETLQDLNLSDNQLESLPMCEPELIYRSSFHAQKPHQPVSVLQADKVLVGRVAVKAPSFDRNASLFRRAPSTIRAISTTQEHTGSSVMDTCDYSSLQKLNLTNNKISMFPEALPCFAPNLIELDISRNPLYEIDVQFIPASLKKLTAKACEIIRIGNVMTKKLQSQIVRNCRHGESAGSACQHRSHNHLVSLTTIDLSHNKIPYMQLIRQNPSANEFENFGKWENTYDHKIAPGLDLLYPSLEGLNLTGNCLVGKFNPNIGHQSHLKWIRLSKNKDLTAIPMEFAYLKNTKQLTELGMDDLPNLVEPPVEYQQVSLNHLLTYMRSKLKASDYYRSIKLFFIGNGERGKTTLLRRLKALPNDKNVERTAGIDIESWIYPDTAKKKKKPVNFIAWDFAGQEVYHTTHQCFYSKRSMYLALFRLTDGEKGIDELEQWLRNVQLRAPGCPVVIVGTHLDALPDARIAKQLEEKAMQKYSNSNVYPKVVGVVSVSCLRKLLDIGNPMEPLRNLLYTVATHLSLSKDGISLEYKPDMSETDPKALFQQRVPKTFLSLQEKIQEKVFQLKKDGKAPIMEEADFRTAFLELFDDEEELNEAVYFLNLQGTLLHFEDHNLRNVYFLDPEWLAKLMADVIHPAAVGTATHIHNGVAEINALFCQRDIPPNMKHRYISLLEKFEVSLRINPNQMIIPSLMPESMSYPKPDETLSDIPSSMLDDVERYYQPPLHRFWVADYIPDGFWPRLICRVATDHQIKKVLWSVTGVNISDTLESSTNKPMLDPLSTEQNVEKSTAPQEPRETLNWTPWKTGMAFSYRGRTLLIVRQVSNEPCKSFHDKFPHKNIRLLPPKHRIEIHIYTNEWVTLSNELLYVNSTFSLENFECLPGLATKLLVMITGHVKTLALSWFPGMLSFPKGRSFITYIPCWKCYSEIGLSKSLDQVVLEGDFICNGDNPIRSFIMEDHIVTAALNKSLECCFHGKIKIMHVAPDLIFWDLSSYKDSCAPLRVFEDEVLGKGGFGFVCKGELRITSTPEKPVTKKNVAVKVFLEDIGPLLESTSISELLELSKKPKHLLFAYKEIRQEVSFLSNLNHPNLTKLCGVRTNPYMCLMLELAPKKSLRAILKEYRECQVSLEPLTLKKTALQIAQGLEYLHMNQVVHLDMKSPNVLIWQFPSPRDKRQIRIHQSGEVLIKIADYGISQVSTGLTLRVDNSPVGTPGFMAPELFDRAGQVISSEKVDVFAYGMVLYELLSQRSPFDNVQPQLKRNHEVRDGHRPSLHAKETRSLVFLQELMMMCWEQEPDNRPQMNQVVKWIQAPEFERLRAEITLNDVKSISCACVCRILPQHEIQEHTSPFRGKEKTFYNDLIDFETLQKHQLDEIGTLDSLIEELERVNPQNGKESDASIDLILPNMLPSVSMESVCIENAKGDRFMNDGEDVYQFLPTRARKGSIRNQRKSENFTGGPDSEKKGFDPYTQIWMCGRDQRKGMLQIFTYNDGHPGHYLFSGYCSRDEITSMCPVRNQIWMGTSAGAIKIFHAPTLKTKFTCTLETEGPEGTTNRTILDIMYVEERRTVLVANFSGEVWSFYDQIVDDGLKLQCKIELIDWSPCYHLAKVVFTGQITVEVWGTMENNRLVVLECSKASRNLDHTYLTVEPKDSRLKLCSYIASTNFTDSSGTRVDHIWLSYRQRCVLVSFDAKTREQRCILNCANQLRKETSQSFQITTLICAGHKVMIGTTIGSVAIFDSETFNVISYLSWHREKVRTLLIMPSQVEPCICAEISLPDQENGNRTGKNMRSVARRVQSLEEGVVNGSTGQRNTQHSALDNASQARPNFNFQSSHLSNDNSVTNPEPESVMITSVGNGKRTYSLHSQTKEDKVKLFDSASVKKSQYGKGSRQTWEDIVFLTWRS